MVQTAKRRKIVRPLPKGQMTIPAAFREALGIGPDTLLSVTLVDDCLEVRPVRSDEESVRLYTDEDIQRLLEEDKLDPRTAARIRALLRKGKL
ncbi:MAG: AbrB/MazE/SpoVT family DNA-binding domain-containing protein [Dehalococcoidia bacterium]|nr:AbrB/MazE/SpoVT family DNA-binding domain-containing protein [Dehalococcoidia bacterium]